MDERNMQLALRIMAVMYILTIVSLQVIVIYRQFALGQSVRDFKDLAAVMIVNSLFLISALLFFGAIPIQRLKIKTILFGYLAIIALGTIFTYVKYNVFQKMDLSGRDLFDKLIIVYAVSGLIVLFWVLLAILGKHKLHKSLEKD